MSEISKLLANTVALSVRPDANIPGLMRHWEQRSSQGFTGKDWEVEETPNIAYLDFKWQGGAQRFNLRHRIFGDMVSTSVRPAVARFGVVGLLGWGRYGVREYDCMGGALAFDNECWKGTV